MNKSLFISLGVMALGTHTVVAQEQEVPGMLVSLQDASVSSFMLSDVACIRFNDDADKMTVISRDRSAVSFELSDVENVKFVGVEPIVEDVLPSSTAIWQRTVPDGWYVVYDLVGRIVKTGNVGFGTPLQGLSSGCYLVMSEGIARKVVVR